MSPVTRAEVSVAWVAARRSAARCATLIGPPSRAVVPGVARPRPRRAPAPRRAPPAPRATRACVSARAASGRVEPVGVLPPASSSTSSIAAPRDAERHGGDRQREQAEGREGVQRRRRDAAPVRSATPSAPRRRAPSSAMSWLPVARRPATSQVSWIVNSSRGNSTRRMSGRAAGVRDDVVAAPPTRQPTISQSACAQPLANVQRPLTTSSSPSGTARPRGAKTPPTIASRGRPRAPPRARGRPRASRRFRRRRRSRPRRRRGRRARAPRRGTPAARTPGRRARPAPARGTARLAQRLDDGRGEPPLGVAAAACSAAIAPSVGSLAASIVDTAEPTRRRCAVSRQLVESLRDPRAQLLGACERRAVGVGLRQHRVCSRGLL